MTNSETLQMFFEEDFVPHAYLDALFAASLASTGADTRAGMGLLQTRSTALLAHLEFYSTELNRDLETQVTSLQSAALSVVSYKTRADDLVGTTRMEAQLEAMTSAAHSLGEDMADVARDVKALSNALPEEELVLRNIAGLQTARENMGRVEQTLAVIRAVGEGRLPPAAGSEGPSQLPAASGEAQGRDSAASISVSAFIAAMTLLLPTVTTLLKAAPALERSGIVSQINAILDIEHVFDGFVHNGLSSSFHQFIVSLKAVKARHGK